ncbi:DUF4139 domain-containing protein [Lysobacter sp. F60174L2]|uniref:DUF4139 domain-containing protein n=1 Tax=Lysobacter sp. F60174L2 TaxID=3459295 RepID=UPI00403DC061
MHRPLSLLALACTLAACSPGERAPDASQPPPAATPTRPADKDAAANAGITRLTVYSGDYDALARSGAPGPDMPGYALVERPLHYTLKTGLNAVSATSVPAAMDVEAASLQARTPGVAIESQRYVAPLSGTGDLVSQIIGQRITVEHTAGGAKQTDTGVLLAASDGLTLALGDGRVKVVRDYDNFSVVDGTSLLPQQAELRWTVRAEADGDADFLLSYPMGGLAWRAEYLARVDDKEGCKLALDGAALVANRAGVTFAEAHLTLVAGEPSRVQPQRQYMARGQAYDSVTVTAAAAPGMPQQRASGEYHAYEVPGTTPIQSGATERVALFPRRDAIACERAYVVDADAPDWQPPRPLIAPNQRGSTGELPVKAAVSVQNTKEAGLGQPLPAGRVRVYDGADFLGESQLGHTPAGAEIRLEVGTVFDLTAEREATDLRVDRSGRTITESFAVTLKNAKDTDVEIRVVEPLPRWSDWEVTASSVPSKKKDARHVEFNVPVAADGETRLTYTVRYRWPEGVTP